MRALVAGATILAALVGAAPLGAGRDASALKDLANDAFAHAPQAG